MDVAKAHTQLIDSPGSESVGKSNCSPVCVLIPHTRAGIAAVCQSGQGSRTDIGSSTLRITDEYLITPRSVIVQANISLVDTITLGRGNGEIVTLSRLRFRIKIRV